MEKNFIAWLEGMLKKENWTRAELARRANINQSTLSMIYNGYREPGNDVCYAIAAAFGIPTETVFRAAGILPNQPGTDEDFEELKHLFNQMTDEEQEEFLATGRLKIDLRNKRGEAHEIQQARPAHV
jgi:transcriptional regulator with XRE-family HTH domain